MKIGFNLAPQENLKVWEFPTIGHEYVIGADVSEGLAGGDYSCAQVISRKSFKQVAVWHGLQDPAEFGRTLLYLGFFYFSALLAVERNFGPAALSFLKKENYPNLYRMKTMDSLYPEETDRIGWHTNVHTRRLIIDNIRACVRDNSLIIMDPETLDEMKTFVKNPDTEKVEASPGNHDDRVMALSIAAWVAQELVSTSAYAAPVDDNYMELLRASRNGHETRSIGRGGY